MLIGGLQKLTLIDFPGKLAATVFLAGCNFRCPFCYSSELVLPEKIKKQPKVSEKEFFAFLEAKKGLLQGVVICGGEPCLSQDLENFIAKIKSFGYAVKLDTNGSFPEALKKLFAKKLLDYVAMDIKTKLETEKYSKASGISVNLENIKKSIELIKNSGVDYEFRTTVVPGIHTKEDIIQLAKDIAPAKKYFLQSFRAEKNIDSNFSEIKPYSQDFLAEIQEEISPYFEICQVR